MFQGDSNAKTRGATRLIIGLNDSSYDQIRETFSSISDKMPSARCDFAAYGCGRLPPPPLSITLFKPMSEKKL